MRRVLSTVLAVALLLGLGALAVLALPNANASLAQAPAISAAAPEFNPDAPAAATNKLNVIAMPLDATKQFVDAGQQFTAHGLATTIGLGTPTNPGVVEVAEWDAASKSYRSWDPQASDGDNFSLKVGGNYRIVLGPGGSTIASFVGDVPPAAPAQGSVSFTFVRPATAGEPCRLNDLSLPLDQGGIVPALDTLRADDLAQAIGSVSEVVEWDAPTQSYRSWDVSAQDGDNFVLKIGYPYRLCLLPGGETNWP